MVNDKICSINNELLYNLKNMYIAYNMSILLKIYILRFYLILKYTSNFGSYLIFETYTF